LEDGILVIEAREEDHRGSNYTSARIKTQYLQSWTYGRIEARMKLPTGQGVWSAFWMLGDDIVSAGWPKSGEIDIMENIGEARTVYGTVHGPGYFGGDGVGSPFSVSGAPLHEDFHLYAIEWSPGEIRWYVDDALSNIVTDEQVPGPWVYDHPFFILLNLAIGGVWPGYPDETTQFPQQLLVDYVRVYRDPTLSIEDLQSGVLHVADITMDLANVDESWEGTAYVTVVDQNGSPVEGVTVTAGWLGTVTGATKDGVTGEDGVAGPFVGTKTKEISFCISDLSMSQYAYDKSANTKTCVFESP
jgi:beta-glucanase (GH16 family)